MDPWNPHTAGAWRYPPRKQPKRWTKEVFFACAIIAALIFLAAVAAPVATKALGNVTHTAVKAHVSMSLQQKGY